MINPLFLVGLIFFQFNASAVIVLKTKEKKALVLLEGLKTQKGAYFDIFDLDGNKKGLAQIDRVAQTKAIVSLKSGSIAKKWFLEPVTEELALYELKKEKKRKALSARIHREQIKRKVAFKKQQLEKAKKRRIALKRQLKREKQKKMARLRALDKKRRLAKKKQAIQRKLASYSLEENVLEDLGSLGEEMEPSSEVLSYDLPDLSNKEGEQVQEENKTPAIETRLTDLPAEENKMTAVTASLPDIQKDKSHFFKLGILPRVEYGFMKVSPVSDTDYFMSGFGFGAIFSTVFPLNQFLSAGANVGAKRFFVSAKEEECGQVEGCSLLIYYAVAGLNLKLNLIQVYGHKLWLMGEGTLLQPLLFSNKVPNLTKESFSPFHGTIGGGLGLELNFGNLTMPISVDAHIYMPPTQTTFTGNAGLQFGLSYKF